eukprot:35971_1
MTFMDGLLQYLKDNNIANVLLEQILQDEEYDTDCIQSDILENKNGNHSNAKQWVNDEKEYNLIYEYIYKIKLSTYEFKVGYRFFYWDKHKHVDAKRWKQTQQQDIIDDMNGYSPSELYI